MSAKIYQNPLWVRSRPIPVHLLFAILIMAAPMLAFSLVNTLTPRPTARISPEIALITPPLASVAMPNSVIEEAQAPPILPIAPKAPVEKVAEALTPQLRAALKHVARRYHVSAEALRPIFHTVQLTGRERDVDPLLLVAIIGIESGFNPFSESAMGALGLMQVVPRFHRNKLPAGAAKSRFLDPVTNVQVGTHVLQESIIRHGGLIPGLQQFGGAINDQEQTYANRVLAEKERIEQAVRHNTGIRTSS